MRKLLVSLVSISLAVIGLQPAQANQLPLEFEVVADVNTTMRPSHALSLSSVQVGERFYWIEYVETSESQEVFYSENKVAHRVAVPIDWIVYDIFEFDSKLMLAVEPYDDPDGNIYIAQLDGESFNLFDEVYLPINVFNPNFRSLDAYGGYTVIDGTLYFSGCVDTNGCAIWSYQSGETKPELFKDVDQDNDQTPIGLANPYLGELGFVNYPAGDYVYVLLETGQSFSESNLFPNGFVAVGGGQTGDALYFETIKNSQKAVFELIPGSIGQSATVLPVTDSSGTQIDDVASTVFVSGNAYFTTVTTDELWVYTGQQDLSAATVRASDTGITGTGESVGLVSVFDDNVVISVNEADGDIRWVSFDGSDYSSPITLATLDASDTGPRNEAWAIGLERAGSYNSMPVIVASGENGAELFTVDFSGAQPVMSSLSMPFAATNSAESLNTYVVGDTILASYNIGGTEYRTVMIKDGQVTPINDISGSGENLLIQAVATGAGTSYAVIYNGITNPTFLAEFDGGSFTRIPISDFPGATGSITDVAYFDDRFWVMNQAQGVYVSTETGFAAVDQVADYGTSFVGLRGTRGNFVESIDQAGLYVSMKNSSNISLAHFFIDATNPGSIHQADPAGSSNTALAGFDGKMLIDQHSGGPQLQDIKTNTKTLITHAGTADPLGSLYGAAMLDGVVYLAAEDANGDRRLYRLDGTEATLAFSDDLILASMWDGFLTSDAEKLWFAAFEGNGWYSAIYTFDVSSVQKVAQNDPGYYSEPYDPVFFGETLLFADLSPTTGTTLFRLKPTAISAPTFSSPAPFAGPVIGSVTQGEDLVITGSNLDTVTEVSIGNQSVEFELVNGAITAKLSQLPAGEFSVELIHSGGVLKLAEKVVIEEISSVGTTAVQGWTKRVSETEIKLYAKNLVGNGKVQFFHQGTEIAWVRAENNSDPKLRNTDLGSYLVRTVNLEPGRNYFEVRVNGEVISTRVQYLN